MNVNRLEALADSILNSVGYRDPSHRTYAARNPGRLRAFLPHQAKDVDGMRIFDKHINGYAALLFDLEVKCTGKSRTGLTPDSPLKELLYTLDFMETAVDKPVSFLRRALNNEQLSAETPLSYFLSSMEG